MKSARHLDVFGNAILDQYRGMQVVIDTFSTLGGHDKIPAKYLFRTFEEMPEIEQRALELSTGKVLDLGCGAGSHADYLQKKGLEVTPVDLSEGAIKVCQMRGLSNAKQLDFWKLENEGFDTILSLMNGAGICGTVKRLPAFLKHLKKLLNPGGQILIDSSDVLYMYEDENGHVDLTGVDQYYGEVHFRTSYKGETSESHPWLYIDFYNLQQHAFLVNLTCELIVNGPHHDYLARVTRPE